MLECFQEFKMKKYSPETAISNTDAMYLRDAIRMSQVAKQRGNRPYGAVIVSNGGAVLAEAYCHSTESGDCTGHAETTAIRMLNSKISKDELSSSTLYASAEPCVMCAGAIWWSGVQRVVFGIDTERQRIFNSDINDSRAIALTCRDIFSAATPAIECIGPALIEEASQAHESQWKK
jgi:tRNA(Arg) A34 adenosine deaminase TadA